MTIDSPLSASTQQALTAALARSHVEDVAMSRRGFWVRIVLSALYDFFDFTIGRIPLLGTGTDIVGTAFLFLLWGPAGLLNALEVFDISEQLDGCVPSATIVGLFVGRSEGIISKRPASVTS